MNIPKTDNLAGVTNEDDMAFIIKLSKGNFHKAQFPKTPKNKFYP